MAARGQAYTHTVLVAERSEVLQQRLTTAAATVPGYTVTMSGPNTVILTRRFTPPWAVGVGVLGILLFLIGLLAFLVKDTETVTIALEPTQAGTSVVIAGTATAEMIARLSGTLGGALPVPSAGALPQLQDMYRECPNCKEQMRRDATVCPHCRQETRAWVLEGNTWWFESERGGWHRYDEANGRWLPGSGPGSSDVGAVGIRDCPSCKEQMSRVATECPHCGRESKAWVWDNDGWLYESDKAGWQRLDEATNQWVPAGGFQPSTLRGSTPD